MRPELAEPGEDRIGFKRHLHPQIVRGEAVYLIGESGVTAIQGRHVETLAPLLDGTRDLAGLLREVPADLTADKVGRMLARLIAAGLVGSQGRGGWFGRRLRPRSPTGTRRVSTRRMRWRRRPRRSSPSSRSATSTVMHSRTDLAPQRTHGHLGEWRPDDRGVHGLPGARTPRHRATRTVPRARRGCWSNLLVHKYVSALSSPPATARAGDASPRACPSTGRRKPMCGHVAGNEVPRRARSSHCRRCTLDGV